MTINVPAAQLDTICRRWREHADHNGGRLHDGPRVNIAGVEIKINVQWDEDDQAMILGVYIDTKDSEIKSEEGGTPMVICVDGGAVWDNA